MSKITEAAEAAQTENVVVPTTKFKSSVFTAKVVMFTGEKAVPNKHGEMPIVLVVIAGKCPKRRVIDGTSAERMGLTVNKSYLFTATAGEIDEEYGLQINYLATAELGVMDILSTSDKLGEPILLDI